MPLKTRRQRRYEVLKNMGFRPFEARQLSKIPFNVPYMDVLMKERFNLYKQAIEEEWSKKDWRDFITGLYKRENWFEVRHPKRYSAFAMLREFEHRYRAKHPEYESPWKKRKRAMKDFLETTKKELAELPPMSATTKRRMKKQQEEADEHFRRIRRQKGQ